MTSKLDESRPSASCFRALIPLRITENGHIKLFKEINRNQATITSLHSRYLTENNLVY